MEIKFGSLYSGEDVEHCGFDIAVIANIFVTLRNVFFGTTESYETSRMQLIVDRYIY